MSESEQKKELGAVARSIDALFATESPPAADPPSADPYPADPPNVADAPDESGTDATAPDESVDSVASERDAAPEADGTAEPDVVVVAAEADAVHELDDPAVADATEVISEPDSEVVVAQVEVPVDADGALDTPPVDDAATDDDPASDIDLATEAVLLPPDAPAPEPTDEMSWEPVEEEVPPTGEADLPTAPPTPEVFVAAVEHFLASPPLERGGQAVEIREMVAALREANALDPLADAVERIILADGDDRDEVSLAIADSMVSAGVASRIVARLGAERDELRREELMKVATEIGLEMAIALSDALADNATDAHARRTFMDAMIRLGPTAMVVLEQMVEDRSWFVVRNAVAILGEVGGDRAVELATSGLAHTDPRVRREALMALGKIGGEDAGLLVHGMLEDSDPKVRLAAAMAAGELKVERALKPLLAMLDDETDPDIVQAIIRALGRLGDPGAVHAIEKFAVASFLKRHPTDVRIVAYKALHSIGTPHASKVVGAAAEDKDPEVRQAVRSMLGLSGP